MASDPVEAAGLGQLDSAPKQLSEEAISWAKRSPFLGRKRGEDEALALAVRSTRYGCQMQGGHGIYSRQAFELLHSKFPDSDAAKRTKYWFDCSHFTFGCEVTSDGQGSDGASGRSNSAANEDGNRAPPAVGEPQGSNAPSSGPNPKE